MGMTYQECIRARKTEPMNKREIIDYYRSNGEQLPDRFSDCEKGKTHIEIQSARFSKTFERRHRQHSVIWNGAIKILNATRLR